MYIFHENLGLTFQVNGKFSVLNMGKKCHAENLTKKRIGENMELNEQETEVYLASVSVSTREINLT